MTQPIHPIILCGGSGTRLWPLSRESFPKQFVPLIDGKSLLQLTLERVKDFGGEIFCVANQEHRFLVQEAIEAANTQGQSLLEPAGRNTAAAMACAALNAKPEDILLFLPADHYIPDAERFLATVRQGISAAQKEYVVTFGVVPSFPSTAFGYIEAATALDGCESNVPIYHVAKFIEKPPAVRAQQFLLQGGHYWNSGIFLTKASVLIGALRQHAPDILAACQQAVAGQSQDGGFIRLEEKAFLACRNESIDYAVLEKHSRVAMVPFAGAWNDVGSWDAVADLTPADCNGNRIHGQGHAIQARNTYINAQHRPVVALGTQDMLIIDTPDALLVAASSHAEHVRDVVVTLKTHFAPQATTHRCMARPWGTYDLIDSGDRFQVKRITVKPGAKLSLQLHHHRAEHWVVVKGTAKVTRGDEQILVSENQSTYIPIGVPHRLENPGKVPLEMIEVQSGSYLGEDDIVRLEDLYGRHQQ
jgi:mannose-1-phosphate guanylyltransferase/mannose-6-phosphate isomerase